MGPDRRASRETLDREQVLRVAIELADESGIESLTMRALGRRLGIKAPSLYNHVESKDDLLGGITDLAVAEIEVPTGDVEWKEAMRTRALSAREVFDRHPWAAALIDSQEYGGMEQLAYGNSVLGVLLKAGFPPRDAAHALLVLDSYVYGFERQRSLLSLGESEDHEQRAEETLAAIPSDAFPSLTRVAEEFAAGPFDDAVVFDLGLGMILDGLERMLTERAANRQSEAPRPKHRRAQADRRGL